jgi:hypothetical protein
VTFAQTLIFFLPKDLFPLASVSIPALRPNQSPIQWIERGAFLGGKGVLSWGVKHAEAWSWPLTPSSAKIKNEYELYSTYPISAFAPAGQFPLLPGCLRENRLWRLHSCFAVVTYSQVSEKSLTLIQAISSNLADILVSGWQISGINNYLNGRKKKATYEQIQENYEWLELWCQLWDYTPSGFGPRKLMFVARSVHTLSILYLVKNFLSSSPPSRRFLPFSIFFPLTWALRDHGSEKLND